MNLLNPVRVAPARLLVAALSFLCIPALAQTVVASPAPTAVTAAPTPAPELLATPTPAAADPAPAAVPAAPAPAAVPAPAPSSSATVTATPDAVPAPAPDKSTQMAAVQTTMTENMAKSEAADIAKKAQVDSEQAGTKSDMEMKHAIIAQLQAMSDQIQQLNERITAITAQLNPPAPVKPVKAVKPRPAVRPPIKPVY